MGSLTRMTSRSAPFGRVLTAMVTPFTDDVDLTPADRRAYADAARAQRHKGFEDVAVSFAHDGQFASARRRGDADDGDDADDVEATDGAPRAAGEAS